MATATKTPRLLAAAKEFNIGKETLVEFLTSKGFEINASNPNTKLTEVMYDALQAEFAQDKLAKRKSEEIALPKGSLLDSLKKNKEDLDLKAKDKKEEPEPPKVEKKKEEKPKEAEKPKETEKPQPPAPVKEEEVLAPVAEVKPEAEEKPKKAVAKKEIPPAEPEQEEGEQHIEVKAPKLEGPNILGKINLDEMNLSSRPKKGAAKKKTGKADEAPEEAAAGPCTGPGSRRNRSKEEKDRG
jgi:translation initiation factor IF-2